FSIKTWKYRQGIATRKRIWRYRYSKSCNSFDVAKVFVSMKKRSLSGAAIMNRFDAIDSGSRCCALMG
ncbi:MAG: hypothetical protein U1B30_13205, partial [Pseudomonadota bacterium]|nr:hypothetical protein [Pseudomonadota bacterium]